MSRTRDLCPCELTYDPGTVPHTWEIPVMAPPPPSHRRLGPVSGNGHPLHPPRCPHSRSAAERTCSPSCPFTWRSRRTRYWCVLLPLPTRPRRPAQAAPSGTGRRAYLGGSAVPALVPGDPLGLGGDPVQPAVRNSQPLRHQTGPSGGWWAPPPVLGANSRSGWGVCFARFSISSPLLPI